MISFMVAGVPVPQGSKRAFIVNGRAVIADVKSAQLRKWRKAVTDAARRAAPLEPIDAAVEVEILFGLSRPVSVKRRAPSVPPDVDKLVRAVLDGLTDARLFIDDSRVVRLIAEKEYAASPGAHVTVRVIEDASMV